MVKTSEVIKYEIKESLENLKIISGAKANLIEKVIWRFLYG